jgi:hypothetical protein
MARRTLLAAAALVGVLLVVGCRVTKEGSGVEASAERTVDPFSRISLSGDAAIVVTVGQPQAVSVRGDDNLLQDVETTVDDGELQVGQADSFELEPKVGINVDIAVPALEAVSVSGAGNVVVTNLRGARFRSEVSGAGQVEATGDVDRVEVEVSGAGDVRLGDLVARDATADVSGAGHVLIQATESLTASVSGAGDIVYIGNPAALKTDVSGNGEIRAA